MYREVCYQLKPLSVFPQSVSFVIESPFSHHREPSSNTRRYGILTDQEQIYNNSDFIDRPRH